MRPKKEPRAGGDRPRASKTPTSSTIVRDASAPVILDLADALAEATARWGGRAIIHEQVTIDGEGHEEIARLVGRRAHDAFAWAVLGWGPTWRDAFEQADAHEGRVRQ